MLPVLVWLNHDAFQSLLGGCLQGDGGAIGSSGCMVCSRIMRLLPHVRARWMAGSRIWNLELYFLFSGVFLQFDTATPRRRSTREPFRRTKNGNAVIDECDDEKHPLLHCDACKQARAAT